MNFSGLVLDMYDDPSSLKDVFPTREAIPESVKVAHALASSELDRLPDDVFALVVQGLPGQSLRKYACVDKGNTELNVAYFLKNAHKLPEEFQKVAAKNLMTACDWYDIKPDERLEKIALGMMQAANLALMGPTVVKGTKQRIDQNMAGVNALEGGGAVVPPSLYKGAEVSGTPLAPYQQPGRSSTSVAPQKATIQKTANHLVSGHNGEKSVEPDVAEPTSGTQYQSAPQAKALTPHVSAAGKSAPDPGQEKKAQRYALNGCVYPLDSYAQVKTAAAYYEEYGKRFTPAQRHEYCVNLVKRASELGIQVSDEARRYGSESYAPAEELKIAYDMRKGYVEGYARELLDSLYSHQVNVPPDVFCETLSQIDKIAMVEHLYDRVILDPYASTYGTEKTAKDNDVWMDANDYITKKQIDNFGLTGYSTLEGSFGADMADEFRKDPWGVFNSLPLTQKRMLARMASDNSPTGKQHVA